MENPPKPVPTRVQEGNFLKSLDKAAEKIKEAELEQLEQEDIKKD